HLARFLVEGELLARLNHPHIVQVFEVSHIQGRPFLVLEYVEGVNLAHYLKDGTLAARDAARMVEQLARAMHYAHQQGIIHRDRKPANVLLQTAARYWPAQKSSASGERPVAFPKITDFGLARHFQLASDLTQTGTIVGTPSYMSPEQARGSSVVGPATDI